jgi:hypothetical protein
MPERHLIMKCTDCGEHWEGEIAWENTDQGPQNIDSESELAVIAKEHHSSSPSVSRGHNSYRFYSTENDLLENNNWQGHLAVSTASYPMGRINSK